jgi:hypothetical protein
MVGVFIVPFHVRRVAGSVIPDDSFGAYVSCYVLASDYKEAIERCIAALKKDGLSVMEILQPINAMQISQWSRHVAEQWPDQSSQLPDQAEFEKAVTSGGVVYGPFGSY